MLSGRSPRPVSRTVTHTASGPILTVLICNSRLPSATLLIDWMALTFKFNITCCSWLADVLGGAFPALLMDQIKISQGRLLLRHPLEQNAFGNDLVGCRNGIVAGIKNLPGAEFVELVFAQLEQADIRPGVLLGVETGLDPGNRFHEIEIQTESVGSALDLLDRRSDRGVLE